MAVYDKRLELNDTLQAAEEYLLVAHRSPFMEVTLKEAEAAADRVLERDLFWAWGEWQGPRGAYAYPLLAIVLLLVGVLFPGYPPHSHATGAPDGPEEVVIEPEVPSSMVKKPLKTPQKKEMPPTARNELNSPKKEEKRNDPAIQKNLSAEKNTQDEEAKETDGMSEGGQSSEAQSSGRSDRSMGAPGNQAPASKPNAEAPKPKKKKPKPNQNKAPKQSKKKTEDKSGATSGRGSSSGSSRNPAVTDWSSKDRVEETEDQDLDEEEDVDDEDTESEARGGLQPNLRDRRPPVNRDLSIGFGNRQNPDANGRGGPSQRKKSRGVASLVLGVPVPDHVKGQPNPGRVKITQEKIHPKPDEAAIVPAEERGRRASPVGPIPQRTTAPWMKRLMKDYFLRLRQASDEADISSGEEPIEDESSK